MLHELAKEEPEKQRAPLETSEFNLTPFVNQSPAEKRLKFETARGRQLGIAKGPVRPMPNIAQVMGQAQQAASTVIVLLSGAGNRWKRSNSS